MVPFAGTGREGIGGRAYAIDRRLVCRKLQDLVNQRGFVIVKAPPQSGKTALLQVFQNHLRTEGMRTVFISCADLPVPFDINEAFTQQCGGTLRELIDAGVPNMILVDEAQLLYNERKSSSAEFWQQLKRLARGGANVVIRVVLAAAYGTRCSTADDSTTAPASPVATPVQCESPDMVVSIFPAASAKGVSLRLDTAEWLELWQAFLEWSGLPLGDAIQHHIYHTCDGQVGLVTASLDFLQDQLVNDLAQPDRADRNAIYKLCSERFLDSLNNVRSFLSYHTVAGLPAATDLLRQLLWVDSLKVDFSGGTPTAKAARMLHISGMLAVGPEPDNRLCFTSPLHRLWYMRKHFRSCGVAPGSDDLEGLLLRVVERMDPRVLKHTVSLSTDNLRLERCWQMEIYRTLISVLPPHVVPSSDAGQALDARCRGYVDFYLSAPYCMALEITRDGKDISRHLERFEQPAKYLPLLQCGAVRHYAVVDIRSPQQEQMHPRTRHKRLFTVLIQDGFESASVWNQGINIATLRIAGDAGVECQQALADAASAAADAAAMASDA